MCVLSFYVLSVPNVLFLTVELKLASNTSLSLLAQCQTLSIEGAAGILQDQDRRSFQIEKASVSRKSKGYTGKNNKKQKGKKRKETAFMTQKMSF